MSTRDVVIKKNRYLDSIFLMAVARRLSEQPGIDDAAAVMGTNSNKQILVAAGFNEALVHDAGPNDLVVAMRGEDAAVGGVLIDIEKWLVRSNAGIAGGIVYSLDEALAKQTDSNLAVISVPGAYAASEAHAALDRGMNVFLFSDHVAVEDEIALKRRASDANLIVMGPDCGTALIAGKGIGFANVVRRGPVGVVASSGTGLQELTSLVHRAGSGVSHGLGTGSRDLSDAVGGISTLRAVEALEGDEDTKVIAVVSKPLGAHTRSAIVERLNACPKPVVACFLGIGPLDRTIGAGFEICSTVDDAADAALRHVRTRDDSGETYVDREIKSLLNRECARMRPNQRWVRGLFAGGTFCYQAQQILREGGTIVHSNIPLAGMHRLADVRRSEANTLIDMGDDTFTVGKPHPMIDSSERRARILTEADDPHVAVLLLDFILGYNASPDPAGDLVDAIREAKRRFEESGRYLSVVASVCGTEDDPQGLTEQENALRDAGVVVFPSSARASRFAGEILHARGGTGGPA